MSIVAAPTKPKTVKKATGPKMLTTQALIKEAIVSLKEVKGSSSVAIGKYVKSKKTLPPGLLARELKKLVTAGTLVQIKNHYKLSPAAKKAPKAPKKKVVKAKKPKVVKAKKAKAPTKAKKAAAPTADGAAPVAKKATKAKTVTKKPASKKPASTKKPILKKTAKAPKKATATKAKSTPKKTKKPATKKVMKKAAAPKPVKA